MSSRIVVAFTNLIICGALYRHPSYSIKIESLQVMKKAARYAVSIISSIKIRKNTNLAKESDEEQLKKIVKSTEKAHERNKIAELNFRTLKKFIEEDEVLKSSYQQCLSRSKDIMYIPTKPRQIDCSDNPDESSRKVISEWGKAQLETNFWEGMKMSVMDFLELNPEFAELLLKKFQNAGEEQKQQLLEYLPQENSQ